jgi:hypothetical protein
LNFIKNYFIFDYNFLFHSYFALSELILLVLNF